MSLKQPLLVPVNDREFILMRRYEYDWIDDNGTFKITVFKGFNCDIASIPRFLWTFTGLVPDGSYRAAALIHDLLYQWRGYPQPPAGTLETLQDGQWQDYAKRLSRRQCDQLFLKIMAESGTSPFKRRVMYGAVRVFGSLAWNR